MPRIASVALACLVLAAGGAAAKLREEVVSFTTHDGLELEGILSLPARGDGPYPGLLLIHGSGRHDADLEIDLTNLGLTDGKQEHFKKLARFLSRKGFAVLRYNKRGASFDHESDRPLQLELSTFDDLVEDARNAMARLYGDPRVDAARLVVWGWSEGTMIAPRLALEHDEITLLVLVGPVARWMEEIARYQLVERYLDFYHRAGDADGDGLLTLAEMDRLDGRGGVGSFYVRGLADALYGLSAEEILGGAPIQGFAATVDLDGDGRVDVEREIAPIYEDLLVQTLAGVRNGRSEYQRSLLEVRPLRQLIHRVEIPMLLVQGEADNQTPVLESEILAARLEDRERDFELILLRGVGHSLAPMRDFFLEDGGLTTLDNPTLNVMKKRTMRRIYRRLRRNLP